MKSFKSLFSFINMFVGSPLDKENIQNGGDFFEDEKPAIPVVKATRIKKI